MEATEIAKIVRDEMAAIEATLKTHVSDEVATRYKDANATIVELRTDLAKFAERGEPATAKEVKDLEARLIGSEQTIQELTLKATSLQQAALSTDRSAADVELFRGAFFKDEKKMRDAVRAISALQGAGEQTRAIDSGLLASGGKLSAEVADRFIDFLIEKQVSLGRCSTRRLGGPQAHTDELTVSRRKLRKAVDGVPPETANGIGTKRRTMNTVEGIWAEDITLEFLEDNIERRGAEQHIARMLATQFGNDMNDLAWSGNQSKDSSNSDGFTSINDGWMTLALADSDATANGVNALTLGTPSNTDILNSMFRNLPVEFKAMLGLGYIVPVPFAERYAEEVATRETPYGDQVLVNGFPALRYMGVPVIPEPHMYEDNVGRAVLTPWANLFHGVQRQITVDAEWRPRKRAIEYTMTVRNDYEYATGKAIVICSNIPLANR